MSRESVLIVEDDDDIRESLIEFLADHGYEARGAANGQEAFTRLGSGRRPRLILLDLMMPIMDGWTFRTEQLRRPDLADIPVVVISAYRDVAKRIEGLQVGQTLAKPIDLDRLLGIVRAHAGT